MTIGMLFRFLLNRDQAVVCCTHTVNRLQVSTTNALDVSIPLNCQLLDPV